MRGRAYNRFQKKKSEERLLRIIRQCRYNPWRGYVDYGFVDGKWQEVGNHIKYPKNSNRPKFYKKQCNRKVRRSKNLPLKGNYYRKCREYWWEII